MHYKQKNKVVCTMNREQRRRLQKKINRMDEATRKYNLFRVLLTQKNLQKYSSIGEFSPFVENYIDTFLKPLSLKSIAVITQSINDQMSIEDSFTLALLLCDRYKYVIEKFVHLKKEYEVCIFSNRYKDAMQVLEDINSECGYSLWSCGQMLVVEEELNGLEGNKKLLGKFLSETHRNTLVSTILEFMSFRAEISTSLNNYNEKVDKFLRYYVDEISSAYFTYKLKIQDIYIDDLCRYVLQIDSQLSIVDLYCSLVDIVQRCTVSNIQLTEMIFRRINSLNDFVNDYVLRNVILYNGGDRDIAVDDNLLEIIEAYTKGDYQYTLLRLQEYLAKNTIDYQMWILFIKCNIYMESIPTNDIQIINDLFSVYSLDSNCGNSMGHLLGYLKRYADTSWRYKLLNTTKRKLSCDENVDKYIALSLLGEYIVSPRFVSMLPNNENVEKLLRSFAKKAPNTVTLLTEYKASSLIDNSSFRSEIFLVDSLHDQGNYQEEIELLNSIYTNKLYTNNYVKEKIIRRLYLAYYCVDNLEEAMSLIVNSYFEDENLIKRCDLNLVSLKIKEKRSKAIFRDINYPIFIYINNRFDLKEHRIAFSNYLDSSHVVDEAGLYNLVIKDNDKYIFFMEKICTISALKRHVRIIKNSIMAAKVRNEILHRLIILNPKKKKDYLEEISDITTKREISNRVRLVSQHKIKVDVEKIKQEKNELFEENFQKYILLKSFNSELLGFDINDSANSESIKNIVESMNEEIRRNTQYSQAILALKDFITDVQYEFLRNEKYGLDTYLSSRIRHGYCKAQLTKELREHHLLLSTADDDSDRYDISQYWDERVDDIESSAYVMLKNALSVFTLNVENKVHEIRRDWIRIRLVSSEVGMFDYTSFVNAALVIDKDNIVDYDMMYNIIIESLWDVTESKLQTIRERIQGELKTYFNDELNSLERKVKECELEQNLDVCKEVLSSITLCRVKMQTVLNEFENFFFRDDVVYDDFSLENMVSTCIGIEKQIHADFDKISLRVNACEEKKICGRFFSEFVEIIVMLMNNAISHAGFDEMREIELSVDCTIGKNAELFEDGVNALRKMNSDFSEENLFIISVKNNLSSGKDIQKIRNRVQYIFENAKDPNILKKYSISEGGSGIYKIYKTINYNVSVPYVILYSVEKAEFILYLIMDASTIIV